MHMVELRTWLDVMCVQLQAWSAVLFVSKLQLGHDFMLVVQQLRCCVQVSSAKELYSPWQLLAESSLQDTWHSASQTHCTCKDRGSANRPPCLALLHSESHGA